jgi:hypothetical protein
MAPGYIACPHLSGCDCLGSAWQNRGFPLDKNSFLSQSIANSCPLRIQIAARGDDDRATALSVPVVTLMLQKPVSL